MNAPCFGMGMFEKVVKGGGWRVGKAWSGCEPQHCTHSRLAFSRVTATLKVGWRYRASTFTDCLSVTVLACCL
jgi:hypothetical protein